MNSGEHVHFGKTQRKSRYIKEETTFLTFGGLVAKVQTEATCHSTLFMAALCYT